MVSRCGARAVSSLGDLFGQRDEYFLAHDTGPRARESKVSAEERERIIRESDYNLDGKPPQITPTNIGPWPQISTPGDTILING